jgi:hypothetical protein
MIGRPKTPLNIPRQPPIGSCWIIQNIITGELCKCSCTVQKDLSYITCLRKFSGDNPFFTVRIGSKHTKVTYLYFLCSALLPQCIDFSKEWKWVNVTQDEADIKCLWYSEPNLVTHNDDVTHELPETTFKSIKDLTKPKE